MMKKISSIIIILLTIIYVNISLQSIGYNIIEMTSQRVRQIVASVKYSDIETVLKINKSPTVEYDKVKQSSSIEAKYNNEANNLNTEMQYELTEEEKERLLLVASKLSAIDQVKINSYLENSDEGTVKDAVSLLRDRLSDKDFEKIKDIKEQYSKK